MTTKDSVTHANKSFLVHLLPTRNVESNHVRSVIELHCEACLSTLRLCEISKNLYPERALLIPASALSNSFFFFADSHLTCMAQRFQHTSIASWTPAWRQNLSSASQISPGSCFQGPGPGTSRATYHSCRGWSTLRRCDDMPTCQHDGLLHCLIGIQLDSQFVFACYLQAESYHTNCGSMMFHGQAAFCMPSLILMGSSSLGHKRLTLSQRRKPSLEKCCTTRSRGVAVDAYAPAMAALKCTAISNEMEEGDPCFSCFSMAESVNRLPSAFASPAFFSQLWIVGKDRLTVLEHFVCADDDRNSTW